MSNLVYEQALKLLAVGIAVIPISGDGTKAPHLAAGHPCFKRRANQAEIDGWFKKPNNLGIAILCGPISGDVEVIDFDDPQAYLDWQELLNDGGYADLLHELSVITQTPSGGTHVWYQCSEGVGGNQKLARKPTPKGWDTLIETRGKGGYAVIPPTPANCHELRRPYVQLVGDLDAMPRITAAERDILLGHARALNQFVEPERRTESPRPRQDRPTGDLRPGDDYNQRGDWEALLTAHGWREWQQRGEVGLWSRPGKEKGISATLGKVAPGIFYVFSSNAAPFPAEQSFDLFGAFARLEHGGDFAAAGKALAAQGFGSAPAVSRNGHGPPPPPDAEWLPPADEALLDEEAPLPDDPEGDDLKAKAKAFDQLKYAKLFAKQFEAAWMYLENEQWWQYQQTHWVSIPRAHAETAVQRFLMERKEIPSSGITPSKRANVLALAEPFLGPVRVDDLNSNYFWIPLKNGVYDVELGRMVDHSPAHRITRISSFDFDPAARCPLIEQFFRESLITTTGEPCAEWNEFIYEWCGYCLLADPNRAQAVLLNVGDGGNGKGVFEGLLRRLVGKEQCCTIDVEQLHDPYQRAQMVGRLVGFISELPHKGLTKNGGVLKAISGGDSINARNPTEKVFSFLPTTRLVTSCNKLPATRDLSRGFFRRPIILDWRNQVSNPNPNLESDLSSELPGFFNLCMAGVRRLMARNWRFSELAESAALLAEYRHSQDTVAQYLEARCEVEKGDTEAVEFWAVGAALHKDYSAWCRDSGYQALDVGEFGKYLTKEGFGPSRAKKVAGKVMKVRPGIRLLSSGDEGLF